MEKSYLMLVLVDFEVEHALVRLLLSHWRTVCLRRAEHPSLQQLESLGIVYLEATVVPVFGSEAVTISLTDLGYACVLSDNEPKLYIPIEDNYEELDNAGNP